ncbi:transcriptional regulator [Psychrobacillus sp. OK032]|uniref:transcriptional regulator n=1 Tax=Psychrobacillus sp. OK032 TaxID=1884358 RepID=UPI0008B3182C|nr:transcriptional regulator [Psychrobacillus sp. OK032]SES35318.1 hypothetical protein SAMN05518872_108212 [Psychrobacillus sp. OK032]
MRINILKSLEHGNIAEMIYMKDSGEISKRKVKVLSVDDSTFKAYCFLRNTKRTFKIDNVLACVPVLRRERDVI